MEERKSGIVLDHIVENSINRRRDVDAIKNYRRCFARALHYKPEAYMRWMQDCDIIPTSKGVTLVFDSWFKADYVVHNYGWLLSHALKLKGLSNYDVTCEGPASDNQRASSTHEPFSCEDPHVPGGVPEVLEGFEGLLEEARKIDRSWMSPKTSKKQGWQRLL
jgi:hypothetical protein